MHTFEIPAAGPAVSKLPTDLNDLTDSYAADPRAQRARNWAQARLGLQTVDFAPASADASFRRYFRISDPQDPLRSWIVMDAPPAHEDLRPFIAVGELLQNAGVHVPKVEACDLAAGFLLLDDLGASTYLDIISEHNADALFEDAIAALVAWQRSSRPDVLPPYDAALLQRELNLFPDWYLATHLGLQLDAADRAVLETVFAALIANALQQPRVFVHRDYMPRNLMAAIPNPGVLDFQDAVYGPLAYDPICLFKDAFLSWPAERVEAWLGRYHTAATAAGIAVPEWTQFRRDCDWIGLHRHLKVLGIFARINYRDGKSKYLADTPRFVRYVMEVAPLYAELMPLAALFEKHVLPRAYSV
ncbi:MAG: aminoglycoside phosphotransferase [Nevskia sp.]|nr:aminoglycoside phosphotransferase [Nevskia sp.]